MLVLLQLEIIRAFNQPSFFLNIGASPSRKFWIRYSFAKDGQLLSSHVRIITAKVKYQLIVRDNYKE